jgi:hypothetical protein
MQTQSGWAYFESLTQAKDWKKKSDLTSKEIFTYFQIFGKGEENTQQVFPNNIDSRFRV